MSSSVRNLVVPSLLFAIVLFQSATSNVFFPVETNHEDLVQYRSLKDILFRSQLETEESQETAYSIESPVVASFRPANPSPTFASSPYTGVGVSKIRFLDADEFFIPSLFPPIQPEFLQPAAIIQTEGRRANAQNSDAEPTALVRQAKSAAINDSSVDIAVADSVQDRWPWPYSKPIKEQSAVNVQSRQPQKPPTLVVKKSVAKPYRLLTRTSTCPKLLHDLTITCSFPSQQLPLPVEFQWYKTQYRNAATTQNNLLDSTIKIPIAFGTQMIHKDSRYGVSAVSNSATLSIRQLKPQDCGSYICEALDAHNTTVLSTSEFLIFLCY